MFVVSGGAGASGEHLVQTALAQFPAHSVRVKVVGGVHTVQDLEPIMAEAKQSGAMIAHTMVDGALRAALVELARKYQVAAVDLIGPMLQELSASLGRAPLGQPGLYRQLRREYFERIAAMEYTLAHDDGMHPEGWHLADVVLVGVSRTGKTPLSIYLSVLGWKAANAPIVLGLPFPPQLLDLDPRRVVGLTIDLDRLIALRQRRYAQMGVHAPSDYVDPRQVQEELRYASRVCRQHRYSLINVSERPIESTADEIIVRLTEQHD